MLVTRKHLCLHHFPLLELTLDWIQTSMAPTFYAACFLSSKASSCNPTNMYYFITHSWENNRTLMLCRAFRWKVMCSSWTLREKTTSRGRAGDVKPLRYARRGFLNKSWQLEINLNPKVNRWPHCCLVWNLDLSKPLLSKLPSQCLC